MQRTIPTARISSAAHEVAGDGVGGSRVIVVRLQFAVFEHC